MLAQLTALGEGFTTEFERSVPANLGAEVCGFANATAGDLHSIYEECVAYAPRPSSTRR